MRTPLISKISSPHLHRPLPKIKILPRRSKRKRKIKRLIKYCSKLQTNAQVRIKVYSIFPSLVMVATAFAGLLDWFLSHDNLIKEETYIKHGLLAYDGKVSLVTRMTKTKRTSNKRNKYQKSSYLMQKGVWWMRNFSSLHNKPRNAEERLGGQRMLYFQRIEADVLNQCFRR